MSETQVKQEFNTQVTYRDEKTGLIVKQDPYILRVVGESGSNVKRRLWERPAGSGNLFDKQMNPVGRWESEEKIVKGKKVKVGKFVEGAEHVKYVAPETADQKLAREHVELASKNAALERELAQMKAESAKKTATSSSEKTTKGQGA